MSTAQQKAQAERAAEQDAALEALRAQLSQLEAALTDKAVQLAAEQDANTRAQSRLQAAEIQIGRWTAEAESLSMQVAELQVPSPPRGHLCSKTYRRPQPRPFSIKIEVPNPPTSPATSITIASIQYSHCIFAGKAGSR